MQPAALAAYKEYVKDQPGSILSAKVAELENKAAGETCGEISAFRLGLIRYIM